MLREPVLRTAHRHGRTTLQAPPGRSRPRAEACTRPAPPGRLAAALLAGLCGLIALGAPAAASPGAGGASGSAGIDVVRVQGLIDPANVSLVRSAVHDAEEGGSTLLVLQIDSPGALDVDVAAAVRTISGARVPVAAWIGPPGASARGGAVLLAAASDVLAVAPGGALGPASPVSLDRPDEWSDGEVVDVLGDLQSASGRDRSTALLSDAIRARNAVAAGVADLSAPTLGDLIVSLDGRTVETSAGMLTLSTATSVGQGQGQRRRPNQEVRFADLDAGGRLSHALATPWVAHLLFVAGAALVVFEFFSLGVGPAGLAGAVAIAMAFAGFDHLPVRPWALALLALGVLGFAVDLQAGRRAFWTAVGAVALLVGSATLYGGSDRLAPAWWTWALVCGAVVTLMLIGMPAMMRARFSAPGVDARGLLGEVGVAEGDLDLEGLVRVRGALWCARCGGATPIPSGSAVRVEAVHALVLEVAPVAPRRGGVSSGRSR